MNSDKQPTDNASPTLLCASLKDLAPGALVGPNLRLAELLGRGGMGSVWCADHLSLDIRVAIKFIDEELMRRAPEVLLRFQREASYTARIKSPHVVQVFDQGQLPDGTPYIVMELLDGESLADRLERSRLTLRETALLVSQVADVLAAAHGVDIVHRDLKPENLFLIECGYELFVKVLDFGIAKQFRLPSDSMTSTGALIGTPSYMSPELIESAKDADERADMWALAVVAYEALAGALPFDGETLGSLCIAIVDARFDAVTTVRDDLPPALDDWFARAMNRDAAARFADAQRLAASFAEAIEPALSQRSVPSPRSSASHPELEQPELEQSELEQSDVDSTLIDFPHFDRKPRRVWPWLALGVVSLLIALSIMLRADPQQLTSQLPPTPAPAVSVPSKTPPTVTESAPVEPAPTAEPLVEPQPQTTPDRVRVRLRPAVPVPTTASAAGSAAPDPCLVWNGSKYVAKTNCLKDR